MLGEQRRRSVDVVSAAHVDALDVAAAAELTTVILIATMICCFAESDFPELSWRIESSAYTSASKGTTPVEGGTPQVKKRLHAVEGGTPQVEEKSTTQWRGSGGSAPWVFHIWSLTAITQSEPNPGH